MSEPVQQTAEATEADTLTTISAFLADNVWLTLAATWLLVIVAGTELVKRVWDLFVEDHPKRAKVLQLVPFILGAASGPLVAPMISEFTAFSVIGWKQGIGIGLGAGFGAIGLYELARETRPLRMLKVLIRGIFGRVYALVTGKELSEEDAASLDRTNKRTPVEGSYGTPRGDAADEQ